MPTNAELVAMSFRNRPEIEASTFCGCFHCLRFFEPRDVVLWTDSVDPNDDDPGALRSDDERYSGTTAICPFCEHDSVLGNMKIEKLDHLLLKQLHEYWNRSEQ